MNARQAMQILRNHGFDETGQVGSHRMFERSGVKVPVPIHGGRDIPARVVTSIRHSIQRAEAIEKEREERKK